MENPDPTKFIAITDHVAALQAQQAEFDLTLAAKGEIEPLAVALAAAEAAILDEKLDDTATLDAIRAAIEEAKQPERDKKRAEFDRQIAELEAKKAELDSAP